jgi:soluble lytic murein transglycosylase-like protein
MFASPVFPPAFVQASIKLYGIVSKFLMVAGFVFLAGLVGVQAGHAGLVEALKAMIPATESADTDEESAADESAATDLSAPALSPRMRGAMDYVAKRYRVSTTALEPVFQTAQAAGKELRLDPLLIIAVIGVESGFNPFSQSVVGAKGLMQVMPRFHMDKLPDEADKSAFLDPVTNVQVGARVLHESIRRFGGLESGLQQFGGALNDPDRRYASKVLAEKQRLEQAAQRSRST